MCQVWFNAHQVVGNGVQQPHQSSKVAQDYRATTTQDLSGDSVPARQGGVLISRTARSGVDAFCSSLSSVDPAPGLRQLSM
jgi:hypothetical protein